MPELLFLLLPVAALYGYVMGRNSYRNAQIKQHEKINQDFLSGLNLFLNNQRDKAIEVLIENLEVNNETFTTHVALGKLFRAKGENDRAIKIHQFLAKQDVLTPSQRKLAIMQLARDYVDSALYDRAETLLKPLVDDDEFSYEARTLLSRIYQTFRDWQLAYDVIAPIQIDEGDNLDNVRAYLLCEIVSEKLVEDENSASVNNLLNQALQYEKRCARAYLMLIEQAIEQKQLANAQQFALQLSEHCSDFISLIIPKLVQIFPEQEAQLSFLEQVSASSNSSAVSCQIARIYKDKGQVKLARKPVLKLLERHATIRGFSHLLSLNASLIESDEARQMMMNLEKMVDTKVAQLPDYECEHCGYQGSFLFWQCPRCKNWGKLKPIRGLTGD